MEKLKDPNLTYQDLKNTITLSINNYINELTGRHPIILPIIMDVKK